MIKMKLLALPVVMLLVLSMSSVVRAPPPSYNVNVPSEVTVGVSFNINWSTGSHSCQIYEEHNSVKTLVADVPNNSSGTIPWTVSEHGFYTYTIEYEQWGSDIEDTDEATAFDDVALLEAQISDLEDQVADLEDQISDLEDQISDLEGQVTDLETEKAALEAQISDLENQVAALQEQKAELETEKSDLESQVSDLESQVAALQNQVATQNAQIGDLQRQNDDLRAQNDALNFRIRTTSNQANQVNQTSSSYSPTMSDNQAEGVVFAGALGAFGICAMLAVNALLPKPKVK